MMRATLEHFKKDTETNVLLHPDYIGFEYSDGVEIERRIYNLLKSTIDRSCNSQELQSKITDWPTEYHFTPIRHNLLRHIDIHSGQNVLELGAGCGAITRQLGETGATITAIEGSLARARVASERCHDLKNVRIHCSDFNMVLLEPKYDVVTLIGVLEYAPIFTETTDPIVDALRFAKSALKPNGSLIIAIENQLGLKYFCGATEDHLGQVYLGVEDRYTARSVRTLGRRELHQKISAAGFTNIEFQYPFPDYKLPFAILLEKAFEQSGFIPDELIRHIYARDYSGNGVDNIDASMAWPVIARNGMMRDMSNSFLIIANVGTLSAKHDTSQTLALYYSNDRAKQYNTITEFICEAENHIVVSKRRIDKSAQEPGGILTHHLRETPYVGARTLHSEILAATKRNELSIVVEQLDSWINFMSIHGMRPSHSLWSTPMPPDFLDCSPFNLLCTSNGIHLIDDEWIYHGPLSLGSLVLRYMDRYASEPASAKLFHVGKNHPYRRVETIRRVLMPLTLGP